MRTDEGPLSLPGLRIAAGGLVRIRRGFAAAPLIIKILLVAALVFFFPAVVGVLVLAALVYAPFALSACRRSVFASLSVAVWGLAVISGLSGGYRPWLSLLLVLPFAVVAAVHAGSLGRWFVPCRTVAWTLLWAVPVGWPRPTAGLRRGGRAGAGRGRRARRPGRARLARARGPGPAEGPGPAGGARAATAGPGPRRRRSAPSTPPRALRPSPGPMPPMTVPPGRPRSRWTRPWPS